MASAEYVVCVGAATLDTIVQVDRHPAPDGRVPAADFVVAGGGPAATAAVTLVRLGIPTFFIGTVGGDEAGGAIRAGLEHEGVDLSELLVAADDRSAQSAVLVSQAGRTRAIAAYLGTFSELELGTAALALCRDAAWVHVDHIGYAAVRDHTGDLRVSVDAGNPIPGLELAGLSLFAPTERALRDLFPGNEVAEATRVAVAAGAEAVVVTRGSNGSIAATRDGDFVTAPGLEIDAVSTLGAGDVFHGALIARLTGDAALRDALAAANVCAALSCRALDGRSAIPTAEELESTLAGVT